MSNLYTDILNADGGVFISGATGSGKSTVIAALLHEVVSHYKVGDPTKIGNPDEAILYLADPKKVELARWRYLPIVEGYAQSDEDFKHPDILKLIDKVIRLMSWRYEVMQRRGWRKWQGSRAFLVIDEIADILLVKEECKEFQQRLTRLLNLCRASGITVILATQSPSRQTVPASVQINCTCKLCLHTANRIESFMVLGQAGAEKLPRYGKGYLLLDGEVKLVDVPYIPDEQIDRTIYSIMRSNISRTVLGAVFGRRN